MNGKNNARAARLDALFAVPAFAVAFAVICNAFWGSAFPFIKMGYRLFAIDAADTASILCFAGVRYMLGSALVLLASLVLEGRLPAVPRGKVLAECCALGLWQTTAQYAFYYAAVALLTGAFGGILNSTQSFLGVILAHFLYRSDRMTPAKAAGCAIGFAGVLVATIGNHGGGSGWGIFCMMAATVIFTASGPWNKSVTRRADSFAVCCVNLGLGGAALLAIGVHHGEVDHARLYADLDDGSGVCRFYEAASRRCLRYEDRPLKCRVPEGYALFQDVMTPEEYLAKTKQGCVWLRQLP